MTDDRSTPTDPDSTSGDDRSTPTDSDVTVYDKLVRDRIPEVIRGNDQTPVTHTVAGEAYRERLREKLVEEAEEFREEPSVDELGDVLEVIAAIREAKPIDEAALQEKQRAKRAERGGFEDGVVLDRVEE